MVKREDWENADYRTAGTHSDEERKDTREGLRERLEREAAGKKRYREDRQIEQRHMKWRERRDMVVVVNRQLA